MKSTRTEKALLAVKRKREITPRQEHALYREAMKAGLDQWWNELRPLGSVVNPVVIDDDLFERIVNNARSKRSHGGCSWRKVKGRAVLWRDLFFFTPDPKADE